MLKIYLTTKLIRPFWVYNQGDMSICKHQLILHIPHSSPKIPDFVGYIVDREILERDVLKLTDWYTEDLFHSVKDYNVKADFSRVFCDVERFADDKKEEMAVFGMGVIYERSDID